MQLIRLRKRRRELDGSRLEWRLERCWDYFRLGRRKYDDSRLRSMTKLEMVKCGSRTPRTQLMLLVLGIS